MRNTGLTMAMAASLGLLLVGVALAGPVGNYTFSTEDLGFSQRNGYDVVGLKGCEFSTEEIGAPNLPVKMVSFLIPQDTQVDSIRILTSSSDTVPGEYLVIPTQPPALTDGSEPPPFVEPDSAIYNSSSPYPGELVELAGSGYRSGYRIVNVRINPLQYIPVERQFVLYTQISFTMDLAPGPDGAVPVYRRSDISQTIIENTIKSLVENPEDVEGYFLGLMMLEKSSLIPQKLVITSLPSLEGHCVDYVVISSEELKEDFQELVEWRTKKGVVGQARTVSWIESHYEGCDTQERIKNFIADCYSTWGTIYVLLGGDTRVVPVREVTGRHPTDLHYSGCDSSWNSDGDHIFGEPGDGADIYPDVFLGRAPVESPSEIDILVDKLFTYEKSPPLDYLTKILLLGGSADTSRRGQGCIDKEGLQDTTQHPWYPQHFFTWEVYGPRVDPDTNHTPPYWEGHAEIGRDTTLACINNGFQFVNHMDHSGAYAMGTGLKTGGGAILTEDVAGLTNGAKYSIIWSYGCSANAFHYESISESFIKNPNGGGIAYIGNTKSGDYNQEVQDYRFFEALFGDSLCRIGAAFATTQGPYGTTNSMNMNLLGDPEMPVWTDTPETLTVKHAKEIAIGPTEFTVTVTHAGGAVEKAVVCLQKGFEAYARGMTGKSGYVTFHYTPETPGTLSVTVTKMDFFPYEGICTVNPIADAYVYCYSHMIDDDNSGSSIGNADTIINPGETIELPVTLTNSGGSMAESVSGTLSTSDPFATIAVDVQSFGDILPESTAVSFSRYLFTVSPDRPDTLEPEIPFSLKTTCASGDTWRDDFFIHLLSDSLYHTCHTVDTEGIQPNDTVTIDSLGITNHGWGAGDSVLAILRTDDTLVTLVDSVSSFGEIPGLIEVVSSDSFVFCVGDSVPSEFNFTMIMRDRFGREWSQAVDLSPPYPPDSLWASSYGPNSVDLCWEYDGPRPGDLLGYNVYRSTSPTGEFMKANPFIIQETSVYEDMGLASYTDYYYTVTAVDSSANESAGSDTIRVRTNPPYQTGWPQAIGPACGSSPAAGDLDRDGDLEAVMASGRKVYVWHHTGVLATGWPKELGAPNNSSPAVADLDFDGDLEIIIGGDSVYAWNHNGTPVNCENNPNLPPGSPGWPQPKYFNPIYVPSPSPTIGDIDGDGYLEVIIGDEAGGVHAWHYNGSQVEGMWPVTLEGAVVAAPAIGNLDDDEELEVVIGTWHDNGYVYVLNHDGTLYWVDTTGGANCASPVLGDLDCDGELEVVVGSLAPRVYVWRSSGSLLEGWPQYTNYGLFRCPALADLDGDDSLEVVAATAGAAYGRAYLRAWDYHGVEIFEPVSLGHHSIITMSPAVGDMDGDGDLELLVACWDGLFYWNNRLHLYEADGSEVLQGFPIFLTGRFSSSPALADLDRDGDIEILMGSDEERMYVWDLPVEYVPDRIEWGMFHHDRWHTGNYHWQIGLYSSSSLATAYNGGRNLCRVPNTDDLWLAYQSSNGVYAALSEDGGKSWLGSYLGNGGYPTIAVTPPPEQGPGPLPYPVVVWTAPEPNPAALWCARLWEGDWQTGLLHQDPNEAPHLPSMIIDSHEPQSHAHLAWEARDVGNVLYLNYGTFQPDDPDWPPSFYSERIDSVPGFDWLMSPCVDVDYLTGTGVPRPHIVYKRADYIYHAMPVVGGWSLDSISQPGYTSSFPFMQIWGDIIHALWAGPASPVSSVDEIWYRTRHVYGTEWGNFTDISESPADSSRFPAMSGGYGSFSEKYSGGTLPVNWEIMLKDILFSFPSPPEDISQTAQRSMFSHINYRQMQQEPRCLYFIWTEGDAPLYQVKAFEYPLYHPAIPLYYIETGQEEPSFYCVERDSFIQFGPEPHKQVDLDSTELLYGLPGLKPYMRYQLVVTGYWEGSEGIEERVDIDGTAERVLKLSPGVPETLKIWVPPAAHMEDRSVDVTITLLEGDWAVVGPMILYEFEKEQEKALLLAEGGSQSAEGCWLTPRVFGLSQSYPNPFRGATTIRYQLPKHVQVRLNVYNICGQLVRTIVDEKQKSGYYAICWDGRDASTRELASGVYFYRLTAGDFTATKKMIVLR